MSLDKCTASSVQTWAAGIGLPVCIANGYCNENAGYLPQTLQQLENWGNNSGRRSPSGAWTCKPGDSTLTGTVGGGGLPLPGGGGGGSIITGIPNTYLLIGVAGLVLLMVMKK